MDSTGNFLGAMTSCELVDSDGDVVNGGEYIEGEIFDDYNKAGERFLQFVKQYEETGDQVNIYNEVESG